MAYNSRNLLKTIVEVQTIYLRYQERGHSGKWIFEMIIEPNYHITRRTLSTYLSVNARRELREHIGDDALDSLLEKARDKAVQLNPND